MAMGRATGVSASCWRTPVSRRGDQVLGRSRIAVLVLAGLLALTHPQAAWAALSASVADLNLPPLTYSHAAQTVNGSLTLTATDTGSGGLLGDTNAGWNVTLQASDFAYSGTNNGISIPAANLAITTAHAPTRVSGQGIDTNGGPRTTNQIGSLDTPRKTLQASGPSGVVVKTYYGIGTYRQVVDVTLVVPARARAGTYSAKLTVTMSAGP